MVAPAFCRDPHIQTARSLALRCKVAMTTIEVVPSLEELSLVDVRGQQCMPGVETNLGELLLTAAETTPDNVCLEVEAESYTFAQVRQQTRVLSLLSNMNSGNHLFSSVKRTQSSNSLQFSESRRSLCQLIFNILLV